MAKRKRNLPTREAYKAYEKVRKSGKYNMFDPRAQAASKLTQPEYLAVIQNYEALMKKYPDVR